MSEQYKLPPPTLDSRAPENVQQYLGVPVSNVDFLVNSIGISSDNSTEILSDPVQLSNLDSGIEESSEKVGMIKNLGSRIRGIKDWYRSAPESAKDRMQLKTMIGSAAVLSLLTVHEIVANKTGTPELADKATLATGLYGLGAAVAYQAHKFGLPRSQKNELVSQQVQNERIIENQQWENNLRIIKNNNK